MTVRVGDQFPVSIKGRNEEGYYELSKVRVERPKDWSSLEAAFNEKRAIAGVVSGVVKGGLSVDVGVRAFMPASRSGAKDVPEMEKLVGQEITCRIIKLDVADEDVVVDRRVVLEEEEARRPAEAVHGSAGRRGDARHRPQPDRLRRVRRYRRRGRAAARGRHFLGPREQAGRRADGGPGSGRQDPEGGSRRSGAFRWA